MLLSYGLLRSSLQSYVSATVGVRPCSGVSVSASMSASMSVSDCASFRNIASTSTSASASASAGASVLAYVTAYPLMRDTDATRLYQWRTIMPFESCEVS